MESQATIKKLKINKNKNIGNVVIVVEGEEEEFKLLKQIFEKILDYSCTYIKRKSKEKIIYKSKVNKNSVVTIINTNSSNMKSILSDKDYKNDLFDLLSSNYGCSLKNVPIYLIWDRDRESNSTLVVKKMLETFGNSRDNDFDMNGLLLLSYPCLEVYELATFYKKAWKSEFSTSSDAKSEIKKLKHKKNYSNHKMNETSLLLAAENMNRSLLNMGINNYDVDSFKNINLKIFKNEEEYYKNNRTIMALSLISIMFMDLGIIEEID